MEITFIYFRFCWFPIRSTKSELKRPNVHQVHLQLPFTLNCWNFHSNFYQYWFCSINMACNLILLICNSELNAKFIDLWIRNEIILNRHCYSLPSIIYCPSGSIIRWLELTYSRRATALRIRHQSYPQIQRMGFIYFLVETKCLLNLSLGRLGVWLGAAT